MESSVSLILIQALITESTLKYLWAVVNASQLMALMPLIDVPVPPNVMILFRFMAIANGDFTFTYKLPNIFREKHLFNVTELADQQALNGNFEFTGYDSGSFYLLQEIRLILFQYYLAFLVLVILASILLSLCKKW